MDVKAVIFDFDETLADTLPGRAEPLRYVLSAHFGREFPTEEVLAIFSVASNFEEQVAAFINDADIVATIVREFRARYYRPERGALPLYPGVRELLETINGASLPLALVTSRYRLMPDQDSAWGVLRELEQLGLTDLFQAIVGYEDTKRHKPEPDPFEITVEQLRLMPENIIAVGDSLFDIRGARAAGLTTAAALWGAYDKVALLSARPDILLEQPKDLLQFI